MTALCLLCGWDVPDGAVLCVFCQWEDDQRAKRLPEWEREAREIERRGLELIINEEYF